MTIHKPTQKMAAAALRGLRLRGAFGRGGTEVGVARAHQLAERRPLSDADVKSMHSFFARHAVDRAAAERSLRYSWNSDVNPSAGFIAWLLWGGDAGKAWAARKAAALREAKGGGRPGEGDGGPLTSSARVEPAEAGLARGRGSRPPRG